MKRRLEQIPIAVVLAAFLATAGLSSCGVRGGTRPLGEDVPVTTVKQTDLQLQVDTTGELRATRTAMLSAPPIAGGSLEIVHLTKAGTRVNAGDIVIEFDPSAQEYNLEQSRSDFSQAEEEIAKAKDDAAVQVAEDKTALLKANFAVRQAELEVSKNDIVSAITAKENLLALEEAKRALAQLQQDIKSHATSNEATIAVAGEKLNKASLAMRQAEENIKNMQVRSPLGGLVVVDGNYSGGFFFSGMSVPNFQEGDQVNPGNIVAQVLDISQMEIGTKISESDRANVKPGQSVKIQIDALPGVTFSGKVKSVAGMAGGGFFFDQSSARQFDATIQLDAPDDRLRPGFTAHTVILGDRIPRAICVPRQALFERDGSPAVYVKTATGFERRQVKVLCVTQGLAVIDGLKAGAEIALVNPETKSDGRAKPGGAAGPTLGGGAS